MNINTLSYRKKDNPNILGIILLILVMFVSDDTLTFGTNINQTFIVIRYILYVIFAAGLFTKLNMTKSVGRLRHGELIKISLIILSFILTMLVNNDFRSGYILQLLTIIIALLIVKSVDLNIFFKYFSKILYFLSVIAIIVFIVAYVAPGIISMFPTTVNFGGVEFNNLGVCAVFKDMSFLRNTSIFREPGIYMIYLLFGIILELFFNLKIRLKYVFVFIVALITTFSTSGILILILIILGYLIKKKTFKIFLIFSLLAIIVGLFLVFVPESFDQFFSKLDNDSSDYVSTLSRLSSFSVPFMIFLDHPFTGSGLSNFVTSYSVYSKELFGIAIEPESSSTNTIVNTFAIFGFTFGAILILSISKLSKRIAESTIPSLFIFLSILMMLSSQELRFSLFFNVLFMYGLVNRDTFKENKI